MVSDAFRVFCQRKIFRPDLWRAFTIDKSLDMIAFHPFGHVVDFLFNHVGSLQSIVVVVMIGSLDFFVQEWYRVLLLRFAFLRHWRIHRLIVCILYGRERTFLADALVVDATA